MIQKINIITIKSTLENEKLKIKILLHKEGYQTIQETKEEVKLVKITTIHGE